VSLTKPALFEMVGYKPKTVEVCDFHNATARFRVISAPARTSKSYAASYEALFHVFPEYEKLDGKWMPKQLENGQDKRIWIVGPDYKTIKEFDYLWTELVMKRNRKDNLLGKFYSIRQKMNSPHQGNMRLILEFGKDRNGEPVRTYIDGKSATNPESLQGEQVYLAILSEAAELEEKVWTRYLGTRCKYVIAPTTPKLRAEWLKKIIEDGERDESLSIASFHFTGASNPHYDWELFEIEKKKAASRSVTGVAEDDPWFAEQFLGMWTGADERLLPFRAEPFAGLPSHVVDQVPVWASESKTFVSMDYGYSDACVALFWAVGPMERLCVLAEIYDKEITSYEFVKRIEALITLLGIKPAYFAGDPKQPQLARIMQDRGLPVWNIDKKAQADRAAGGQALVDALSINPLTDETRLSIVSDKAGLGYGCPSLIRELRLLRKRTGPNMREWSDASVVGEDHGFDAMRYGIMTRPRPSAMTRMGGLAAYFRDRARAGNRSPQAAVRSLVGASPSMAGTHLESRAAS